MRLKRFFLIGCCLVMSTVTACGTPPANNAKNGGTAVTQNAATGNKELDTLIELAKKEGEVTIVGQAQTNREEMVKEFEKTYGIKVKYTGMRPSEATPKILAEQQQGKYLTDIMMEATQQLALQLYPNGASEDIRNYILPSTDITKDDTWYNGYETGYQMAENTGQYVYGVMDYPRVYVNNDVIEPGALKQPQDMLDPKWKGKIIIHNFARHAQGNTAMTALYLSEGQEFIEKLMKQEPMIVDDARQMVEWFAMGKFPIGVGVDTTTLNTFVKQGVIQKVGKLQPKISTVLHPLAIGVLKNPPHPNAAKLFVNWFLSKEGQTAFVQITTQYQSRRKDVEESPDPTIRRWATIDYKKSLQSKEADEVMKWVTELGKKAFTTPKK
ncbi:ABC transporter substrate-binding protein [Brevibacillus sp. NRS-1366]|uniref:ABC transporter substrate-binding protein n=1 Tax=Brevibacillus sp. NRS-1366 TaxID=3233899 RepID=UPI003D24EB8E